jgi:MinD-like ATPase involved in chromosome partitioning or flagellar assembly
VAASLAVLSARSGVATIVVELDSRGKLAALLNADQQAGLADCLRLGINPLAAITPSTSERIHVLGHGSAREGFLSLAGAALEQVYDELKANYKAIIILAPPLDHAWSRLGVEVDGLVIVSRADRSRAGQVYRYFQSRSAIATHSASVVLNLVDPEQCDHLRV